MYLKIDLILDDHHHISSINFVGTEEIDPTTASPPTPTSTSPHYCSHNSFVDTPKLPFKDSDLLPKPQLVIVPQDIYRILDRIFEQGRGGPIASSLTRGPHEHC